MRKTLIGTIALIACLGLGACNGLMHDTRLSYMSLSVKNMKVPDGEYSLFGSFTEKAWDSSARVFRISGGQGSYEGGDCALMDPNLIFAFVEKGTTNRPWALDGGTSAPATPAGFSDGKYEANTIRVIMPMDGQVHRITLDGSTDPMQLVLE